MSLSFQSFEKDDPTPDIVAALREEGAVVVRHLMTPEVMDSLTAKLAPELNRQEAGGGEFFGYRKKSIGRLFAQGPAFSEHLLLNERVLEITDAILLPEFPMARSAPGKQRSETIDATDYEELKKQRSQRANPLVGPTATTTG